MNQQTFYTEIKNNWEKILPFLSLPSTHYICEIDKNFYVFPKKQDMEYARDTFGGTESMYDGSALVKVIGKPANGGTRIHIQIRSKVINSWQNNPRYRDSALRGAFGHITKGFDGFEHFSNQLPNVYSLILNETVNI